MKIAEVIYQVTENPYMIQRANAPTFFPVTEMLKVSGLSRVVVNVILGIICVFGSNTNKSQQVSHNEDS